MITDLGPAGSRLTHTVRNHLTTLLGHAQLLRRRISRTPQLTEPEREQFLGQVAAIERATHDLQVDLDAARSRTSET